MVRSNLRLDYAKRVLFCVDVVCTSLGLILRKSLQPLKEGGREEREREREFGLVVVGEHGTQVRVNGRAAAQKRSRKIPDCWKKYSVSCTGLMFSSLVVVHFFGVNLQGKPTSDPVGWFNLQVLP